MGTENKGSTSVRTAVLRDMPKLMAFGRDFAAKAGFDWFDPDTFSDTLERLIEEPSGIVFLHEDGMIGALAYPHYMNNDHVVAQEIFWYAERNGGALLKSFEEWAEQVGADEIQMSCLASMRPKSVARYYGRKGYKPTEFSFARSI